MKKNVKNRLFEQQYNNVMKRLGTAVRRILESEIYDTDEDDVYKIENISDLTLKDFYNPSMNTSFANYKDNCIFCRGNKIGFVVKIVDEDRNDAREITIFRDSFGKALEDFEVILQASIYSLRDSFFKIKGNKVVKEFFDAFREVTTEELVYEIDERARDLFFNCFDNAESVDDVVKGIKRMENDKKNDKVKSRNDVYKIENISDLTLEDFYDPSMNASFANYKDNCIFCRGDKIGFVVKIVDEDRNDAREITIFRDSFGKALEDFEVIISGSIANLEESNWYEFRINDVVKQFFRIFRHLITDDMADEFDERGDDFFYKCIANAESVDDVVNGIKRMENNF